MKLRAQSTLAALPPFSSTVAVLEMCNNLEKLTRGYFSTLHFWLLRFKHFKVADKSPCGVFSADDSFLVCNTFLANLLFTYGFAFFLSFSRSFFLFPFMTPCSPTQPFSSSARRREGECVGTNIKSAESDELERKSPND